MSVAVPTLAGRTEDGARNALADKGFKIGKVETRKEKDTRPGIVLDSHPQAGTNADDGASVDLVISDGGLGASPSQGWMAIGFFILAAIIIVAIIVGINYNPGFLTGLGNNDTARGLITFLIAFVTAMIAVILVLSYIISDDVENLPKRADLGKQIFTALVGILGTVIGYYYGVSKPATPTPTITTQILGDATKGMAYTAKLEAIGVTSPLTWSVTPPLPPGLTLDASTGGISGNSPNAVAKTDYTFTVKDSSTPPVTVTRKLSLTVQ